MWSVQLWGRLLLGMLRLWWSDARALCCCYVRFDFDSGVSGTGSTYIAQLESAICLVAPTYLHRF